jgi:hypothetical protein
MGTEAFWVPAVIAAAGAGVQAKSQDDMLERQDNQAAEGIRQQGARQKQADDRIAQEITGLENSTPEDSQAQATDAFMSQLKRTRAQARGEGVTGATSSAYAADSARAADDVDKYGANRAGVLGRINAPGLQRTAEGVSMSRAGSDIGAIARNANGDNFLNQLRLNSVRANPWMQAGGQVLTGVGTGMAANGGYGSNKPMTVPKGGVARYDAPVNGFDTRGLS